MNYKLVIIGILYIFGLYFIIKNSTKSCIEGFNNESSCPNLLMKKDDAYYLYNTNKVDVPGVNPIRFERLEDYKEFMDWLRGSGIHCPVLYLQQTYDTQGQRTYKMLPDPDEPNSGLPPGQPPVRETPLFDAGHSKGSMPGFDPMNQYIGDYTPLDKMFHEEQSLNVSDNPMDSNWGGVQYSEEVVQSGKYAGDTDAVYVSDIKQVYAERK
jgi:hypothetical protein